MGRSAVKLWLVSFVIGLAMAGPVVEKTLQKRTDGYTQPSKPMKPIKASPPEYEKGAESRYYKAPSPSYKSETPEYYEKPKHHYSTIPQPHPKQGSYSHPSPYYKPSAPGSAYYRTANVAYQSTPSSYKQPKHYSTSTAAPLVYLKEESYKTQQMQYHAPSAETYDDRYYSGYSQDATESPYRSQPAEAYKKPSNYVVSSEASYYEPTSSYASTASAPMMYYDQPSYTDEAAVYSAEKREPHYSTNEGYSTVQEEYHPVQQKEYYSEMPHSYGNAQNHYSDSEKYGTEETEYHSVPEHYATTAVPVHYSSQEKENYYSTTQSYGKY